MSAEKGAEIGVLPMTRERMHEMYRGFELYAPERKDRRKLPSPRSAKSLKKLKRSGK